MIPDLPYKDKIGPIKIFLCCILTLQCLCPVGCLSLADYEESLVSSNLNSKLLWYYSVRPNLHTIAEAICSKNSSRNSYQPGGFGCFSRFYCCLLLWQNYKWGRWWMLKKVVFGPLCLILLLFFLLLFLLIFLVGAPHTSLRLFIKKIYFWLDIPKIRYKVNLFIFRETVDCNDMEISKVGLHINLLYILRKTLQISNVKFLWILIARI